MNHQQTPNPQVYKLAAQMLKDGRKSKNTVYVQDLIVKALDKLHPELYDPKNVLPYYNAITLYVGQFCLMFNGIKTHTNWGATTIIPNLDNRSKQYLVKSLNFMADLCNVN